MSYASNCFLLSDTIEYGSPYGQIISSHINLQISLAIMLTRGRTLVYLVKQLVTTSRNRTLLGALGNGSTISNPDFTNCHGDNMGCNSVAGIYFHTFDMTHTSSLLPGYVLAHEATNHPGHGFISEVATNKVIFIHSVVNLFKDSYPFIFTQTPEQWAELLSLLVQPFGSI